MASDGASEPSTEFISSSNIDEIVETLYNTDDELIGYACKSVVALNTVEPMDLVFYMDLMTPKASAATAGNSSTPQEEAIKVSQEVLLRDMSREFQIDPTVSRGVRCFDLPVDGSTWIVEMTIETRDFKEVTIFGGCRELEWDPETHDCKFYEAHMKGSHIGAVATDKDGLPLSDVVGALEGLINGPLAPNLSQELGGGLLGASNYEASFLGVPVVADNPNFQGGDQGRDILNEPSNIKMGIDSSQLVRSNRKTITAVGGVLVACFVIAFALVGYILYNRRQPLGKHQNSSEADLEGHEETGIEYAIDKGNSSDDHDGEEQYEHEHEDEPEQVHNYQHQQQQQQHPKEYPNLPMSVEAIQMDLGNAMKGQMMGGYESTNDPRPSNAFDPEHDHDETDSWAQSNGTIGSLELQLEPITAEV